MAETTTLWWEMVEGPSLLQGDWLSGCFVPVIPADFDPGNTEEPEILVEVRNVIVLTQSCDLENDKAPFIAVCPIHTLSEWEAINPEYKKKGSWERVRQGRVEGLHMLAGLSGPQDNHDSLVVDFRQIYSLPIGYLKSHAERSGSRPRLRSPFLEHFAQAFARFFMRVGLPSDISRFT